MALSYFHRQQRRLLRRVVIGIIITGIVVSLSAILPLYKSLEQSTQRLAQSYAAFQARAITNQLERYLDIAKQFASRSEIARLMQDYHEGLISLEQLQQETLPRFIDATRDVDDLIAAVRLTNHGDVVVLSDKGLQQLASRPIDVSRLNTEGLYYYGDVIDQDSGTVLLNVTAAAPIVNAQNETVGHDVLVFAVDSLLALVAQENEYAQFADYCLVDRSTGTLVRFDGCPQGQLELGTLEMELPDLNLERHEVYDFSRDGTNYLVFSTPLANSEWTLLVQIPAFSLYEGLFAQLLWLSIVLIILVVAGAWYMRVNLKPVLNRISEQNRQLLTAGQVFERANEAIVVTDFKLDIQQINPAARRIFSLSLQQGLATNLQTLFSTERTHPNLNRQVLDSLIETDVWQGEVWYKTAEQSEFPALQTVSAVKNETGEIVQLIHIFNDITQQKGEQEAIRRQALTDELTGLPNRAGLELDLQQCVRKAIASNGGFALLFMDLDKFKPVNDQHGHAVGDKLLQLIGPRLKELVRSSDVVARLGGDEFVILLCGAGELGFAREAADKMVRAMNQPFEVDGIELSIGASVGVAIYPDHGSNQEDLLKAADKAMYKAKQNGRNRSEVAG